MNLTTKNIQKNKTYYNHLYSNINVQSVVDKIENIDVFLEEATITDTSWVCMYRNDFANQLKGKKVLELGCGDCTNAAVMAALGAEVWANDISDQSEFIIVQLNEKLQFQHPIRYIKGDFLNIDIPDNSFDIIVGKAFVHHLTHEQENQIMKKVVKVLKPKGRVRYVEPAVNSKFLDTLRWMTPVPERPSSLQKIKFRRWLEKDPHPERDNSGKHFKNIGLEYFIEVSIVPVGSIERLNRFFPKAKWNRKFRRTAFKIENYLPSFLRYGLARTQTIDYRYPLKKN